MVMDLTSEKHDPPTKYSWKQTVNKCVDSYWVGKIKEQAASLSKPEVLERAGVPVWQEAYVDPVF